MSYDWLFAPTDNVNLLIEIAVGILVTAWVAGVRSKQRLVAYFQSEEANPVLKRIAGVVVRELPPYPKVPTVAEVAAAVKAQLPPVPDVPTLDEIANEVQARLPEVPTVAEITGGFSDKLALFEEKTGQRLQEQMDAKWAVLQEQLSERVGRVVQANIASAKANFKKGIEELEEGDTDLGFLGEILGMVMDEESVKKLGKGHKLYQRAKAAGGGKMDLQSLLHARGGNGGAAPGLPPVGEIRPGADGRRWLFTGDVSRGPGGWMPLDPAPTAAPIVPAALPAPPATPIAARAAPTESLPDLPPEKPAA